MKQLADMNDSERRIYHLASLKKQAYYSAEHSFTVGLNVHWEAYKHYNNLLEKTLGHTACL